MNEKDDKTMREKVEMLKMTPTINFSITKCATDVYQEFIAFCRKEANDSYAFGLKLLMDSVKQNIKETVLYENLMELKDEIFQLKQEMAEKPKTEEVVEEKKPKTMGSKKKKGEDKNEQTK